MLFKASSYAFSSTFLFLLDLLSFERPDALPTICALAVKVSGRRPEFEPLFRSKAQPLGVVRQGSQADS
jgi:hypothetical protein